MNTNALVAVLEALPAIKEIYEAYEKLTGYLDQLYVEKLRAFVETLEPLDEKSRNRLLSNAIGSDEEVSKLRDQILLAIQQSLDTDKPRLIAKLLIALSVGAIDRDAFGRLVNSVTRAHTPDLIALIQVVKPMSGEQQIVPDSAAEALEGTGLTRVITMGIGGPQATVTPLGKTFAEAIRRAEEVLDAAFPSARQQ